MCNDLNDLIHKDLIGRESFIPRLDALLDNQSDVGVQLQINIVGAGQRGQDVRNSSVTRRRKIAA